MRDLTAGAKYDVPPGPFGGSEGYAWSPDGRELAYTAKDQGRTDAWTTDVNVYTVSADGGATGRYHAANKGADQNPVYSPDGRFIAYASQARAGFESDRWRLMLYDRTAKRPSELLPDVGSQRRRVLLGAGHESDLRADDRRRTRQALSRRASQRGTLEASAPQLRRRRSQQHGVLAVARRTHARVGSRRDGVPGRGVCRDAGRHGVGRRARASRTRTTSLVSQLALNPAEDFWFTGADGAKVQGFLVKPPNWQAGKEVSGDSADPRRTAGRVARQWHGRWNYQMFAATGAALVIINPRGSTGYGQKFVDDVSKDWGGKVYTDLMNGLDAALAKNPWIDRDALGAAGGSYGGYMVNWIAGHTTRFKALVSHAGPFNLENMATATEELWFPDWEYGGPFWDPKAMASQYRVYSPHLFVKNFKTPTLVTGGELDYRVPYTEDLSMFTSLQRMNVPSRLVIFPDEGHWIGKPQNQRLWWGEVQGWMTKYLEGKTKA